MIWICSEAVVYVCTWMCFECVCYLSSSYVREGLFHAALDLECHTGFSNMLSCSKWPCLCPQCSLVICGSVTIQEPLTNNF